MKRLLSIILFSALFILFPLFSAFAADTTTVPVHLFGKADCTHCQDAKEYLTDYSFVTQGGDTIGVDFVYHDIAEQANKELFHELATHAKLTKTVPLIFINGQLIQGFADPDTTGPTIDQALQAADNNDTTIADFLQTDSITINATQAGATCSTNADGVEVCWPWSKPTHLVKIPLLGTIDIQNFTLTSSALILGFIDGFNPCAMRVLVMFLTALIQFGNKRKMFQVAGIFIVAEAIMYYLILSVRLYARDRIGLDSIITPIVWVVAVAAAVYFLYDRYTNKHGVCKVWSLELKRKTSNKVKELAAKPMTIAVFFAILALAFSVNVIEFACSVGIPQAFTKLLDINALSALAKHRYMFLYILMYMVDDVIVFGLAIRSFDKIGLTNKYARRSHFIGGLLMLALGLIMLIDPSILVL